MEAWWEKDLAGVFCEKEEARRADEAEEREGGTGRVVLASPCWSETDWLSWCMLREASELRRKRREGLLRCDIWGACEVRGAAACQEGKGLRDQKSGELMYNVARLEMRVDGLMGRGRRMAQTEICAMLVLPDKAQSLPATRMYEQTSKVAAVSSFAKSFAAIGAKVTGMKRAGRRRPDGV